MASNLAKNNDDAEGKSGFGCLYVKVSMDGAPYLRKVDLKTYSNYSELSVALEKMFSCFTIGTFSFSLNSCRKDGLGGLFVICCSTVGFIQKIQQVKSQTMLCILLR